MLTYHDCLGMCEFSKEEIKAIAEHEHISGMAAVLLAEYLIHRQGGGFKIQQMIMEDIERAEEAHDSSQAQRWRSALRHFVDTHPRTTIRVDQDRPRRRANP